jgi:hypothetical protein
MGGGWGGSDNVWVVVWWYWVGSRWYWVVTKTQLVGIVGIVGIVGREGSDYVLIKGWVGAGSDKREGS